MSRDDDMGTLVWAAADVFTRLDLYAKKSPARVNGSRASVGFTPNGLPNWPKD